MGVVVRSSAAQCLRFQASTSGCVWSVRVCSMFRVKRVCLLANPAKTFP
jgi:hypothetical protein